MIGLTFLKKWISTKQVHKKRVIFFTIVIFLDKGIMFHPNVCNGCHDVLMISIYLNNIAALNIPGADDRCIINGISKRNGVTVL